jgi:hypothetical protein
MEEKILPIAETIVSPGDVKPWLPRNSTLNWSQVNVLSTSREETVLQTKRGTCLLELLDDLSHFCLLTNAELMLIFLLSVQLTKTLNHHYATFLLIFVACYKQYNKHSLLNLFFKWDNLKSELTRPKRNSTSQGRIKLI